MPCVVPAAKVPVATGVVVAGLSPVLYTSQMYPFVALPTAPHDTSIESERMFTAVKLTGFKQFGASSTFTSSIAISVANALPLTPLNRI